jgi:hypothetical protein
MEASVTAFPAVVAVAAHLTPAARQELRGKVLLVPMEVPVRQKAGVEAAQVVLPLWQMAGRVFFLRFQAPE